MLKYDNYLFLIDVIIIKLVSLESLLYYIIQVYITLYDLRHIFVFLNLYSKKIIKHVKIVYS